MKTKAGLICALSAAAAAFVLVSSESLTTTARASEPAEAPESDRAAKIAYGEYIVRGIGMCGDCHTPMTEDGHPDEAQWLLGSELAFAPIPPIPWMPAAPAIAGLPTMTEEQGVHYFMTGERPIGDPTLPPMPQYRMKMREAEAVVAYLKSLAPGAQ